MPRGQMVCPNSDCRTITGPKAYNCPGCGHTYRERPEGKSSPQVHADHPPAVVRPAPAPAAPRIVYTAPRPNFDPIAYGSLGFDPGDHFNDMVERENQIYITCAAIRSYARSDSLLRNHLLYFGPSSAGKTSFATRVIRMVGEHHCMRIDAQTATKAGVMDEIKLRRNGIRLLVIDELEKNMPAFGWLLAVLEEGKFQQMQSANMGDGLTEFEFCPLVLVTVNDVARLRNFESGAFYKRLRNKVFFPPISDAALVNVLKPYVDMIDGKMEWIPKVIEYVRGAKGGDDIREMIAVLTDGAELWDDGSYADILRGASEHG